MNTCAISPPPTTLRQGRRGLGVATTEDDLDFIAVVVVIHASTNAPIAFSSEVDTGSREENASKQKIRASVLIQSEPKRL